MAQKAFVTYAKAALLRVRQVQREIHYWQLYELSAAIDARLRHKYHLRDSQGRALTKFDQWLLAAERGEWPGDG